MKVLIVRFAAIGDCVMTAWAVTALREAAPTASIVWAVQERCAPVIDTDHLVNGLHTIPRDRWKARRWSPAVWREQIVSYTALRKERFDVGFDFQGHSKTALLLRLSGARERLAGRATDALAARLNPPVSSNGVHEVERALDLVRHRFEVRETVRPMMPAVGSPIEGPFVSLQTGAGQADKTYPTERWVEVAHRLVDSGFTVVATGGPSDPRLDVSRVVDGVGKFDLRTSMGVVAGSVLHVAADTGTGHVAAAYGVPVVSLFGRTDPARFRPWAERGTVLRPTRAVADILPEDVVEACLGLTGEPVRARVH